MHAVVVRAAITDYEKARKTLQDETIPTVKGAPGFMTGYWLAPIDGKAMSVIVFETETAAQEMQKRLQPGFKPSEWVTIESSEVREVAGSA